MVLYSDIGVLNPPGICGGTTIVLYCGSSGETDPADPAGAKKGDCIGEISSLPFPYVGPQMVTFTKGKGREEISPIQSPFLAPAGSAGSVSPLLPQYNTTVVPPQIPGGFRKPTLGYNTIFYNQTLYGPMSGFTGN